MKKFLWYLLVVPASIFASGSFEHKLLDNLATYAKTPDVHVAELRQLVKQPRNTTSAGIPLFTTY